MTAEAPTTPVRKCAICGKPATERYRPFCSKRCADVDLNRWLTGRYAIPAAPDDAQESAPASNGAGDGADEDAE